VRGVLTVESLRQWTGRGVRVAVIDSGVHAAHPHVGGVAGGIGIDSIGDADDDYVDRLGHGTAVTAAIREKAPEAELFIIKVFDRELSTTGEALVAAIEWAVAHEARLINLSLGTTNSEHEAALADVVAEVRAAGADLIAAGPQQGTPWLPGSLPGVIGVELDLGLPRDSCEIVIDPSGEMRVRASGYPRPIPGVPPERNLKGLSFAVANTTGLLARVLEGASPRSDVRAALRGVLRES
jgi:subtilisin family serine protease